tara:strand:+ start:843 stop:1076 length:234 start_codon:yes stop_codon:yes gene_type:complete
MKSNIEKRIDDKQNEFIERIVNYSNRQVTFSTEDRIYNWKRLKELQKNIMFDCISLREIILDSTKEKLEEAYKGINE